MLEPLGCGEYACAVGIAIYYAHAHIRNTRKFALLVHRKKTSTGVGIQAQVDGQSGSKINAMGWALAPEFRTNATPGVASHGHMNYI